MEDPEDFEAEEIRIIESCIEDNADDLFKHPKIKKRRRNRKGKVNYWNTEWGNLIRDPNVKIPSSSEGKLFKRRFRVEFGCYCQNDSRVANQS